MLGVRPHPLPVDSLLQRYACAGAYTDCYATEASHSVTHGAFVAAFYTTAVFKLERLILRYLASRPSTDAQARQLSRGEVSCFAAWSVEARSPNELLLCDFTGRTRSWLMVVPSSATTRLLFGSAVVPARSNNGHRRMGVGFNALLGFHKIYSQVLLAAARRRLSSTPT